MRSGMGVLRPLVIAVLVMSAVFVLMNVYTALQSGASPLRSRLEHAEKAAENNMTTDMTMNEYSRLLVTQAHKETHLRGTTSTADKLEMSIAAAERATARLEKAAREAQEAMASVLRDYGVEPPIERGIEDLKACFVADFYDEKKRQRNETLCVSPKVQLQQKLRVRLLPKAEKGGKRAFFFLSQGLRQHPMVTLVGGSLRFCADKGYVLDKFSDCEENVSTLASKAPTADIAIVASPAVDPKFYSTLPNKKALAFSPYRWADVSERRMAMDPIVNVGTKKVNTSLDDNPTLFRYEPPVPRDRVIFIDENDSPGPHKDVYVGDFLAYFKRSWVNKDRRGLPLRVSASKQHLASNAYFPMSYALADEYIDSKKINNIAGFRPVDVLCTLRSNSRNLNGGRERVLQWLQDYAAVEKTRNMRIGPLSSAGRTTIDTSYFATMRTAKIVVTCNPNHWEGDFRLFEALSSGALVLVDRMKTPYHHPLVDGVHVLYYDHTNRSDLITKIDFALQHPTWARAIAVNGYRHVLAHHRAVSWVDFFLRTTHALILKNNNETYPNYLETGLDILNRTKQDGFLVRDDSEVVRAPPLLHGGASSSGKNRARRRRLLLRH